MRRRWLAGRGDTLPVARGERLLARAVRTDAPAEQQQVVGGTRDALYLPQRLAWELVLSASWDDEAGVLTVVEVAPWGEATPVHALGLRDAAGLLQLVRERVQASLVVQRSVPVEPRRSVRIIARRAPAGHGPLAWFVEYDDGLAPDDPAVAGVVDEALARARGDVGE